MKEEKKKLVYWFYHSTLLDLAYLVFQDWKSETDESVIVTYCKKYHGKSDIDLWTYHLF